MERRRMRWRRRSGFGTSRSCCPGWARFKS
jgi:hypothetical protein